MALLVSDDGRGVPELTREGGFAGMQERARLIEATLEVQSSAGRGTDVVLAVPVRSERR